MQQQPGRCTRPALSALRQRERLRYTPVLSALRQCERLRTRPALLLCNGPGTCVPVAVAALLLRLLGVKYVAVVYVESVCRVETLSLSGKIMLRLADHFLVQWPGLAKRYPRAHFIGRLC